MKNYDLIDAMQPPELLEFDPRHVAELMVKQLHLMMTKLAIIRDASHSAKKREIMQQSYDALLQMTLEFQSRSLDTAIRNSDRSTLLCADAELARCSVGLVIAESTNPSMAFWLVGQGGQKIDVSSVVKK